MSPLPPRWSQWADWAQWLESCSAGRLRPPVPPTPTPPRASAPPERMEPRGPGGPVDLSWADLGTAIAAVLADLPAEARRTDALSDARTVPAHLRALSEGAYVRRPELGIATWRATGSLTPLGDDLARVLLDELLPMLSQPTPPTGRGVERWLRLPGEWFERLVREDASRNLLDRDRALASAWVPVRDELYPGEHRQRLELEDEGLGDTAQALLLAVAAWIFARQSAGAQRRLFHAAVERMRAGACGGLDTAYDLLTLMPSAQWPQLRVRDLETLVRDAEPSDRALVVDKLWSGWPTHEPARLTALGRRVRPAVAQLIFLNHLSPAEWESRARDTMPQLWRQVRDLAIEWTLRLAEHWEPATAEEREVQQIWIAGEAHYRHEPVLRAALTHALQRPRSHAQLAQTDRLASVLGLLQAPPPSWRLGAGLRGDPRSPLLPTTWGIKGHASARSPGGLLLQRLRAMRPTPAVVREALDDVAQQDVAAACSLLATTPHGPPARRARRLLSRIWHAGPVAPRPDQVQWVLSWALLDPQAPHRAIGRWLLGLPTQEARLLALETIRRQRVPVAERPPSRASGMPLV